MSSSRPEIIDCHIALGVENYLSLQPADYLRKMLRHGVVLAIARPTGAELAVNNQAGNDRTLGAGPGFRCLATANPWYGKQALAELNRCRAAGAVGLYLHPTRQGFMPTDPIVTPVLNVAREAKWPVVIHTGTYIQSDVLAVAELARRHTDLIFVCDAAGFSDMWFELPGVVAELPNVFLCASMIWPRAIANTIQNFGVERILFGSGEPRDDLAAALNRCERLGLNETQRNSFLSNNARRVFRLP